jgi:hypothetical protein
MNRLQRIKYETLMNRKNITDEEFDSKQGE